MSGDIINLRQARKARKRRDKDARAAENRVVFGRTKAERDKVRAESERAKAQVDAHQLRPHDRNDDQDTDR